MSAASKKLIVNLLEESSNISQVMAGPWRDITVDTVTSDPVRLESHDVEHAGFVLSGVITATSDTGETFTLRKGGAFALPQGGQLTLTSAASATFMHTVLNIGA